MVDLRINNIKQKKRKVKALRHGQCSETSSCPFFKYFVNFQYGEFHFCRSKYF